MSAIMTSRKRATKKSKPARSPKIATAPTARRSSSAVTGASGTVKRKLPVESGKTSQLYGVRGSSKLATVISMLHRTEGATLEAMCKATGWQAHSVRGALAGAIKKKLGLNVVSEKTGSVRTYRIAD